MKNIKLITPKEEFLMSYLEVCREFKESNNKEFTAHDPDTFDIWKDTIFLKYQHNRQGINLPEGYVPASSFWLVEGDLVIGIGDIRHRLTPALEKFGGHIGYVIRPSKWNLGYGTLQLGLLLKEAFDLGINNALITCDDDNIGSYRVMEKNGGVYQDTIENIIDGQPRRTRRYWFNTSQAI